MTALPSSQFAVKAYLVALLSLALVCLSSGRADAQNSSITATFKSDSGWQDGYNGTLSIRNGGNAAIKTWTATLQSANPITDAWNATCKSIGGTQYALTPASWTSSIAVGSTISVGFTFSGSTVVAPTALVFNGQSVVITSPTPTPTPTPGVTPTPTPNPSPGFTPTPTPTVTPSPTPAAAPGKPTISVLKDWANGGYTVTWATYSGGAAMTYKLLEDGALQWWDGHGAQRQRRELYPDRHTFRQPGDDHRDRPGRVRAGRRG